MKPRWADIPDDAPLPKWPPDEDPPPLDVIVSKHGIKIRAPNPLKTKPHVKDKNGGAM